MSQNKQTLYIYTRVSSVSQVEKGQSLEAQKQEGIKKAKQLQMEYQVFEEKGKSAWKDDLKNRYVLMELLDYCESGVVGHLFVTEWDRITRNETAQIMIKNILKKYNVIVHTTNQDFDFNDTEDEFISSLMGILAHRENTLRVKRSRRGMLEAAKKGKWHGGVTPFGYKIVKSDDPAKDGRLKIDPEEIKWYKQMVEWYIQGVGSFTIANRLNELHVPTRGVISYKNDMVIKDKVLGKRIQIPKESMKWNSTTVLRILRSPLYKGELHYENVVAHVPAVISENKWNQIQANRKRNLTFSRRNNLANFYLLRGLLKCKKCGRNLYGRIIEKLNYGAYICTSKIPTVKQEPCALKNINMVALDNLVWNSVKDILANSDTLIESAQEYLSNKSTEYASIQNQVNTIERQITVEKTAKNKLLDLYLTSGGFSKSELDEKSEEYNARISELNRKREKLINQLSLINNKSAVLDNVEYICNVISRRLDSLSDTEKQQILRQLIEKIIINWDKESGHSIELVFRFPLYPKEQLTDDETNKMFIVNHPYIPGK